MKRLRFPKLNPLLSAELKPHRKTIIKGLLCTVVVGILNNAPLPLMAKSLNAIEQAAPLKLEEADRERKEIEQLEKHLSEVSESLGVSQAEASQAAKNAYQKVREDVLRSDEARDDLIARAVVDELKIPQNKVEAVLKFKNKPRGDTEPLKKLAGYCALVVLIFGVKYFFSRSAALSLSKAATGLATGLRGKLFAKIQRLPISYFGDKRAGAIHSVLTSDVQVLTSSINVLKDSIEAPITVVIAMGYVLYNAPQLMVLGLIFMIPMTIVIQRNSRRMKASQFQVQNTLSDLSAMTAESLQGVRVVKAFAAEDKIAADYEAHLKASRESQIENARISSSLRPIVELLGAVAVTLVLYICGWLSYGGHIDLGVITSVIFAFDRINQGFKSLSSVSNNLSQIDAASDRINSEVFGVEDQVVDRASGLVLDHPQGKIEFRNVTFRYPDGTEALSGVNFTLHPGTSLALVGPSGAGKSTIADLLLRFYDPSEGQILFDDVDVRDLNLAWLRRQVGVVPQQTFLFAGTIADNVRLGAQDAPIAEVEEAGRLAHVEEFVCALPSRYESKVGEGGSGLSGGQRQRVSIARALVRKPALLLLDEATSALDAESERAVTEALDEVMKQRTTLFIAHRLTTAARADRILVLARGKVVEVGSHAELMQAGGAYAGLFAAFSGGVL